jgi:hypothetical protein
MEVSVMQRLVSPRGIEPSLDELPALLTVDDVAAVLRIGKSLVYTLARQYEASGGTHGIPVIRVGCSLRSPKWAIIDLVTTGKVAQLQN